MFFSRSCLAHLYYWFKRLQKKQPGQKNEAKKNFPLCSHFRSARKTISWTVGDCQCQGSPVVGEIPLDFFWRISLSLNSKVSHLRNRSCYLWVFAASRCKPFFFFFSSLFLSLDSLDCFQVLNWFCLPLLHPFSTCRPLKSPGNGASPSSIGLTEVRSLACMPTPETWIKPTTELLIALLKTPC